MAATTAEAPIWRGRVPRSLQRKPPLTSDLFAGPTYEATRRLGDTSEARRPKIRALNTGPDRRDAERVVRKIDTAVHPKSGSNLAVSPALGNSTASFILRLILGLILILD